MYDDSCSKSDDELLETSGEGEVRFGFVNGFELELGFEFAVKFGAGGRKGRAKGGRVGDERVTGGDEPCFRYGCDSQDRDEKVRRQR